MLLKNAKVYRNGQLERLDVLICGERITQIGLGLDCPGAETVDLSGLVLSPGLIDLHTHLREPGFSQKETIRTGTLAAAAGGFTTVCAMPNLSPVPDSLENLKRELAIIRRDACVEVLPYGAITRAQAGEELAALDEMAPFCVGFSDDGKGVQSAKIMEEAMMRAAEMDKLLAAHCEEAALLPPGGCVHDGAVAQRFDVTGIPAASEWRQVARDLALAEKTGVRYHVCHISTKESVELVRQAKARGVSVTCECTPHQLMLCQDDIIEDAGRFKMNPPLRDALDRKAIVRGLLEGVIDCVATDHAPHTKAEKAGGLVGSAFGVVGLETAFAVCFTALVAEGLCTLPLLLERLADAPARILHKPHGIYEGGLADLTVIDESAAWHVNPAGFQSMGRASPFEGKTLKGRVVATWARGRKVY